MTNIQNSVDDAIRNLVLAPNYPCGPAIASFQKGEYIIGNYSDFGSGKNAKQLYKDLLHFRDVQKETKALYMSFWAVFKDEKSLNEEEFEAALWRELSSLSSAESVSVPWDPNFSSDPAEKNFCLSLGGEAFFVVGLHTNSSRNARKFPWPSLVFNLYEQFEDLSRQGIYERVVQKNRAREVAYQGAINPMVELHGDKWESIQFSGKQNPSDWKCPFHRAATT